MPRKVANSQTPRRVAPARPAENGQSRTKKRALKKFQDEVYPELLKAIRDAAGFEVEVEVDWDSITREDARFANLLEKSPEQVEEHMRALYFTPVIESFQTMAEDDMGRDALREGVARVRICNESDSQDPKKFRIEERVVVVDHGLGNAQATPVRKKRLVELLEASL